MRLTVLTAVLLALIAPVLPRRKTPDGLRKLPLRPSSR